MVLLKVDNIHLRTLVPSTRRNSRRNIVNIVDGIPMYEAQVQRVERFTVRTFYRCNMIKFNQNQHTFRLRNFISDKAMEVFSQWQLWSWKKLTGHRQYEISYFCSRHVYMLAWGCFHICDVVIDWISFKCHGGRRIDTFAVVSISYRPHVPLQKQTLRGMFTHYILPVEIVVRIFLNAAKRHFIMKDGVNCYSHNKIFTQLHAIYRVLGYAHNTSRGIFLMQKWIYKVLSIVLILPILRLLIGHCSKKHLLIIFNYYYIYIFV